MSCTYLRQCKENPLWNFEKGANNIQTLQTLLFELRAIAVFRIQSNSTNTGNILIHRALYICEGKLSLLFDPFLSSGKRCLLLGSLLNSLLYRVRYFPSQLHLRILVRYLHDGLGHYTAQMDSTSSYDQKDFYIGLTTKSPAFHNHRSSFYTTSLAQCFTLSYLEGQEARAKLLNIFSSPQLSRCLL